jgi:hypothetical protein
MSVEGSNLASEIVLDLPSIAHGST